MRQRSYEVVVVGGRGSWVSRREGEIGWVLGGRGRKVEHLSTTALYKICCNPPGQHDRSRELHAPQAAGPPLALAPPVVPRGLVLLRWCKTFQRA